MALDDAEVLKLGMELGQVFSPAAPIDKKALFAGRTDQLRQVVDVIGLRGQHAIVFGERGVGKTSLANVLSEHLEAAAQAIVAPRVNCDGTDDFNSLWRKVFSRIQIAREAKRIGFSSKPSREAKPLTETIREQITPELVARTLATLGKDALLIVIIDEFDRLRNKTTSRLFADTVKTLSDYSVPATLVIVGVGDDVDELVSEHESVERALVQVRMPRMSRGELDEIVENALAKVEMNIDKEALEYVSGLSQGLPHYTHLLGLYAARAALDSGTRRIELAHVDVATIKAVQNAQQTIIRAYKKATTTPRKKHLYDQVLLSCALAKTDELGYFAPSDVRPWMSFIMGKHYDIPTFVRHLEGFSRPSRGPVLQRVGSKRRYRFRFMNPMMQPFVIMHGLSSGLVERNVFAQGVSPDKGSAR